MWFVGYILAHRWTDALPYPSLRQMSRRTGVSTQMLHRYKQSLVEKGYLSIVPRHRPSGGRTSNGYDFSGLFARLEELLGERLRRAPRGRNDPTWQPAADETEGAEVAGEGGDAGDEAEDEGPTPAAGAPVPPSQRPQPAGVVRWEDVIEWGRQRALTGGGQPRGTGGGDAPLPAGTPPAWPSPADPAGPQESRLTPPEERDESHRRGGRWEPSGLVDGRRPSGASRPETSKRSLRNVGTRDHPATVPDPTAVPVAVASPPPSPSLPPDPAAARWAAASAALAETVTPAALNAWLLPLTPVALVAPTAPGTPERLVLACASAFQREHVARRYRDAIEAAAGAACELVVQPRADAARPEPR